ncbi:hypothetical protein BC941DRAFT_441559, partial [Chlamydoabsidia padenii]
MLTFFLGGVGVTLACPCPCHYRSRRFLLQVLQVEAFFLPSITGELGVFKKTIEVLFLKRIISESSKSYAAHSID